MRSKHFVFCFILILLLIVGITCLADVPSSDYQLMFRDDFNGTELDTDLWSIRGGTPYGGKNLAENVRIANGKLYLDYKKLDGYYTGGGILTNMPLPYGYYETKAKVFSGVNGFHSSFWLSGGDSFITKPTYYPDGNTIIEIDGFEIDSNEWVTQAPNPYFNTHYWWGVHSSTGGGAYNIESDGNKATLDEFTMGIEWLPGKAIFYANGVEVGRNENITVYGPSYLWLTGVATPEWQSSISDYKKDENGYFGSSTYEYAFYAQKKLKGVNLLGNGHFELNRSATKSAPKAFDSINAKIVANYNAHNGFCYMQLNEGGKAEQQLPYLVTGIYGFEGYFRAQAETIAKVIVKNKAGTVLKSATIPVTSEWKKLSIPDISITDSAFISIECTKGLLVADDLSFFCQEGDASYTSYKDTDYESYDIYNKSYGTIYAADTTVRSGTWSTSNLNSTANLWMQVYGDDDTLTPHYKDVYATWSIPVEADGTYTIELYNMQYMNNVLTQDYEIAIDGTVVDTVTVDSYSATPSYNWIILKNIEAEAGQTVTVKTTPCAPVNDAVCSRISPLRFAKQSETILGNTVVAQIGMPNLLDFSTPKLFDVSDLSVVPYMENQTVYLPRDAVENALGVKLAGSTAFVAESNIEDNTDYVVDVKDSLIFIQKDGYSLNNENIYTVLDFMHNKTRDPLTHGYSTSDFVGTGAVQGEEVHKSDEANLTGNWLSSSLGYNSSSKYTNATEDVVSWSVSPKTTRRYSIQFYSVVHNGSSNGTPSTKNAELLLHVPGKGSYIYSFDQCDGSMGWYDLGHMDLNADDTVYMYLSNGAAKGTLRASAVRFVPSDTDAKLVGDFDEAIEERYKFTQATTTGNWLDSGIGTASYYGSGNASARWKMAPAKGQKYSVQIYIPTTTSNNNTTTKADVALSVDGKPYHYTVNECMDTNTHTGWYDLGLFDLKADSVVELFINEQTNGFLRAADARLVPYPNKPYATKNGTTVTLYSGTISRYKDSFLFAEYDSTGKMVHAYPLPSLPKQSITLKNASNTFKCFFWQANNTFHPITEVAE
ncbi:MAG: glycoside hydrolase family 16 protein [Clostridia bacterium]|nr:glycoside hydrolase family 16 protein [Clostridia bacterium]